MGEKTKGRKRHIVVDVMGNLLAVKVHAANIHDTKAGEAVFAQAKQKYPTIQAVCADAGYCKTFKNDVEANHHVVVHISEKTKPHQWEKMPWHWIVERTFSWLNGYRLLSKDYEMRASQETTVIIAHFATLLRRL